MQQTLWTSRTFNFDFPVRLFPVIIARLKGAHPRIKEAVHAISDQKLIHQGDSKWSIQQHIGHLIDLEELHSGRITDFRNNEAKLRAWDGLNIKTEEADHNSKNITELLFEFKTVRDEFVAELLKFSDDDLPKSALHPRLNKEMRVVDMAFFVAEHDDHHIARIFEIINSFK